MPIALSDQRKQQLWKCRCTLREMFNDRHYEIKEESYQQFNQLLENMQSFDELQMKFHKQSSEATVNLDECLVLFTDEQKVGVQAIKHFIHVIEKNKCTHLLLVLKDSITPFGKNVLQDIQKIDTNNKLIIEVFKENELQINPTKHSLTPLHEKLSKTEKNEITKRFAKSDKNEITSTPNIQLSQLPRILKTDPICKYYGLVRADVVRITRKSTNTQECSISYRLVM